MTNTECRRADELKIGDRIIDVDGKASPVTGIDHTPAAVRIRVGRFQRWMRSKPTSLFTVAI